MRIRHKSDLFSHTPKRCIIDSEAFSTCNIVANMSNIHALIPWDLVHVSLTFGNGPNTVSKSLVFQTPNSDSFFGLTDLRGESSVSSFQPIICVPKRTNRVLRRTHRVCRRTQWVLPSETVLSKQYSTRFLYMAWAENTIVDRCMVVEVHSEARLLNWLWPRECIIGLANWLISYYHSGQNDYIHKCLFWAVISEYVLKIIALHKYILADIFLNTMPAHKFTDRQQLFGQLIW